MGVLAILATLALAILNPFEQFSKAADLQRKTDLAQAQRALEAYYQDFGRYPTSTGTKLSAADWGVRWSPYIDVLPKDANISKNYVYKVTADGQSYWLFASLDRGGRDAQACNKDGSVCSNAGGLSCGSGICNFGVSSPNTSP